MNKGYYSSLDFDNEDDRLSFINYVKENNLSIEEVDMLLSKYKLDYYNDFEFILEMYAKKYSIDFNRLKSLCKITSMELIKNLNNKNIISILNMSDDNFNKFINLFREDSIKLNEHSLNNIFESFAQRSFVIDNHQIVTAFTMTLKFIKKGEYVNAKTTMISMFKNDYKLIQDSEYDIDILLDRLINGDKKATDFYHDCCNRIIDEVKNEYVKSRVIEYKNSYLENTYETNASINAMLEYLDYDDLLKLGSKTRGLTDKEKSLLFNENLMNKLIRFKNKEDKELSEEVKSNLFIFNRLLNKMFLSNQHSSYLENLLYTSGVKKTYVIPDIDKYFLLDTICNLEFDKLYNVLSNEDLYNGLDKLLSKYKFLSFHNNFYEIEVEADTYCDPLTVASIIMNYEYISNNISNPNMVTILDVADIYSNASKKYELLFGEENFKYLTINPAPNKAIYSKNERREKALEYLKGAYERNIVNIPSFDKDYELSSNKKINATVGNFTDPMNLTLGERTGSCARIGGIADSLYDFCMNNEKGFNIVFKTLDGKLISKVSGFRNGNTVFLNQLRDSVIKDYDDKDLVEMIEKVSDDLILFSKDSPHPIENIIISDDKVMSNSDYELSEINIGSLFEKVGEDFAINISDKCAIVLKTKNKDNSLCEFKPGDEYSDKYEPVRDKVKYSKDPTQTISRMNALNEILDGKKIDEINIEYNPYVRCFYGEDWYIGIDSEDNITAKIFDKSRNKLLAQQELNSVLSELSEINKIFDEKVK